MFFGSVSVVPCLCWSRVVGIEEKMLSIFVRHIHACKFMQSVLIVETSSCREDILFVLSYRHVWFGSASARVYRIQHVAVREWHHPANKFRQCWHEFAHAVREWSHPANKFRQCLYEFAHAVLV
jgi:hypothetical protein